MVVEFQVRNEAGRILFFKTFREAEEHADKDTSAWKISFAIGDERIRLIKNKEGKWEVNNIYLDKLEF